MTSGLVGVPMGAWLGAALIKRFPRSHAVICGVGLLVSAPAMTLGMVLVEQYFYGPFISMFIGQIFLNLNWAIVADMSMVRRLPRDCPFAARMADGDDLNWKFFFVLFRLVYVLVVNWVHDVNMFILFYFYMCTFFFCMELGYACMEIEFSHSLIKILTAATGSLLPGCDLLTS